MSVKFQCWRCNCACTSSHGYPPNFRHTAGATGEGPLAQVRSLVDTSFDPTWHFFDPLGFWPMYGASSFLHWNFTCCLFDPCTVPAGFFTETVPTGVSPILMAFIDLRLDKTPLIFMILTNQHALQEHSIGISFRSFFKKAFAFWSTVRTVVSFVI